MTCLEMSRSKDWVSQEFFGLYDSQENLCGVLALYVDDCLILAHRSYSREPFHSLRLLGNQKSKEYWLEET